MDTILKIPLLFPLFFSTLASFPNNDQWISLSPWQQSGSAQFDYYNFDPKNHPGYELRVHDHHPPYDQPPPHDFKLEYHGHPPEPLGYDLKPHDVPGYDHGGGYDGHNVAVGYDVKPAIPRDVMVDVINNLGINLLAIHNEHNDNNIALSPYGAISVLAALSEGIRGEAVHEILHAAHLPKDRHVVRVGLRDIHRHLKSYFIPEEGFLAGLTLNLSNVTLRTDYEDVLKFYGFDYGSFNNALYPEPPTTSLKPPSTTSYLRESTDSIINVTELETRIKPSETATVVATTESKTEMTTLKSIEPTATAKETTTNVPETTAETKTTPLETTTNGQLTTTTAKETTTVGKVEEITTVAGTEALTTSTETITTAKKEVTSTEAATTLTPATELPKPKEIPEPTTAAPTRTTLVSTTQATKTPEAPTTVTETTEETTTMEVPTTVIVTTQQATTTIQAPTTVAETTMPPFETTTNVLENLNVDADLNMLGTTLSPPFFDDSQTTTPFFIGTMADIPQTTPLPPEPNFDYYNYQDVNAPLQQPVPNYEDINPGLINNMANVPQNIPQQNLQQNVDIPPNQPVGIPLNQPAGISNQQNPGFTNNNLGKREVRSVGEFVHGGYFEDPHRHETGYYLPADPKTFSIYGKYREPGINFMKYDTVLPFAYLPNLNAVALSFPLDSSRYYLLLLLPVQENGVDQLVCDLRLHGGLKYVVENLKMTHVVATIPSFMLKGYVSLTPTLQKLGIREVFEPRRADFSLMTEEKNIYVTNIEQAVTVTIRNYLDPSAEHYKNIQQYDPVYFTADHPFLYFVLDSDLNVALMVGKVVNPLNSRVR